MFKLNATIEVLNEQIRVLSMSVHHKIPTLIRIKFIINCVLNLISYRLQGLKICMYNIVVNIPICIKNTRKTEYQKKNFKVLVICV